MPLYVCVCAGFFVIWSHINMCMCVYHHTITTYVRVQPITKKQAVACPPQLFIADTLNTVSLAAAADSHTSVCIISKIPVDIATVHHRCNFTLIHEQLTCTFKQFTHTCMELLMACALLPKRNSHKMIR